MKRLHFSTYFLNIILVILIFSNILIIAQGSQDQVPGITDDTILIGIHSALTGPNALYGKQADMNEAIYLEWGKNINGRDIKVIKLDDACNPVKGIAAVKKLIYEYNVFLVHGGTCSNVCLAVRPIMIETGTPFLSQGAIADGITTPIVENIFNPGVCSSTVIKSSADFAMTIPGQKTFGIVRHLDEWAKNLYDPLVDYLKDKYNVSPVVDVIAEKGAGDFTPQILKLKQAKVNVVFAILYYAESATFLRDAYKLGLDIPIMGSPAGNVTDQYKMLKNLDMLKNYFCPYWNKYPLDHPKVQPYRELFNKYFPRKEFDVITAKDTSALFVIDALKKCGRDLTQEKFIKVVESFDSWNPDNFMGAAPITFSKTDHVGMDKVSQSTIATGKTEILYTYDDFLKLIK